MAYGQRLKLYRTGRATVELMLALLLTLLLTLMPTLIFTA